MVEKQCCRLFSPDFLAPFSEKIRGKTLYCSFSGGADSLALLLILHAGQEKMGYFLKAVHFEHGFRGKESLKDAEFCRKKCEEKEIPFQWISLDVPANKLPGEGDEEAARRLRLAAWEKIITEREKEYIVTGHHGGDVAENMLLRLFRGGNVSSLTSLRSFSIIRNLTFFRPFLQVTKKDLEEYLLAEKESVFCCDSTNKENFYKRNFLRNKILPEICENFPFAEKGILSAARSLQCDASFIEEQANFFYDTFKNKGYMLSFLDSLHDAVLIRILRYFLREHALQEIIPDGAMLQRFKESLALYKENCRKKNGEAVYIPVKSLEGGFFVLSAGKLFLKTEKKEFTTEEFLLCTKKELEEKKKIIFPQKHFTVTLEILEGNLFRESEKSFFYDLDFIRFPLYFSFWHGGEKMIPFGRKNFIPVKKLFSDARIPALKRDDFPLISDENKEILCVGKLRRGVCGAVTEKTKNILKITFL